MENIYKGEITLIKIKDGNGIIKVLDFYRLGKNPEEIPEAPSTSSTVEQILTSGWSQEIPAEFGKDNPVVWNFKRTEYGDGLVEHSEVVVASFWATAPEVIARYSATGQGDGSTWDLVFDETIHNYIIFSYDGGATWIPEGGIRIKGKVSVDEEAVMYSIQTTQNEILRYVDTEAYASHFSPGIIEFSVQKEYIGIIDTVDLVEDISDTVAEQEIFKPEMECYLVSYADLNEKIKINEIFDSELATVPILEYNYNENKITLNFGEFYNVIDKKREQDMGVIDNQSIYSKAMGVLNNIESFLEVRIHLKSQNGEDNKLVIRKLTIRYSTSYDLAKLSVHANGIVQSIQNTKLTFNAEGLTVQNGGIKVYGENYIPVEPTEEAFAENTYYILTDVGYIKAEGAMQEGISYYAKENYKAFGVDEFGNLYVKGVGEFSGKIYASEGEFRGNVKAKGGFLENLTVNGVLTVAGEDGREIKIQGLYAPIETPTSVEEYGDNLYYYSDQTKAIEKYEGTTILPDYDYYEKTETPGIYTNNFVSGESGFWLDPTTGQIQANSIILGSDATIYDQIRMVSETITSGESQGFGAIYNPNKHSNIFIEAGQIYSDDTKRSTLKITTDGRIFAGNISSSNYIVINGTEGSIQSGDYLSGGIGWRIDNNMAEFNDIIANGTLGGVNFQQGQVSTISGGLLSRPSSVIKEVELDEQGDLRLTIETNGMVFKDNAEGEPYYFRIGSSKIAYAHVKEEVIGEEEIVAVTVRSNTGNYGDISRFIGQLLIGYGNEGDIGVGINTSSYGVGMPPRAISVFETKISEPLTESAERYISENPRIILGQITDKKAYGLNKYGLYADQVNVKGELTSKNEGLYSGINSNSQVKELRSDSGANIIFWAGAQYEEIYKDDEEHIAQSIQNAPFRVDEKGNVYAASGYFSGEIYGSTISTSILKAAVIEGIGPEFETDEAALTIRNAKKGIEFEDYFWLTDEQILSSVPINIREGTSIQKEGITTGFLSLSELLLNGSTIAIKASEDGYLTFQDENSVLNVFASDGFYAEQNVYLDKNIYFGNETMEYRQILDEADSSKILGYDLFIKS